MICTDWNKGVITRKEAWRNLNELSDNQNKTDEELVHIFEVAEMLSRDENDEKDKS
jgi:hypothetical protein